ncbi:MAG TPA: caspase family protein [Bradyrhizobium sp.]|uniref:caspase family protein n=1 Tax=Bradyrhizobium sp. TaxID=376 RepID=UPI002CD6DB89|nr:caspase family protein [Bradyrhizobium sp.]HLZ02683.1 caspase family protein [Bradyrhizobium sp.]
MIRRLVSLAAVIGATIAMMVLAPTAALADKRVALVIGNSAYQNVPKLPNPSRDANAVAKMFKDAGFDSVDVLIDVGNLDFKRGIRKFEETSDDADIAVIYYAGHGLEIAGSNYLIPIDAKLASDRDADDEAIPLERLVSSADGAKRLRLIILDACRDNPFVGKMRRERSRSASRGVQGGLGKVEPTETDTLIAYAAKAGSTAEDGDGQHSPFTTAILKDLPVPGLDVRLAFGRVRDEVMKSTGSRQEPFVYGSLGGGNVALVPAPAKPQEAPMSEVKADFELVQKIGTQRAWEVFLGTHPTGFYADLARAQIDALNKAVAVPPPAPPSSARSNDVASLEPNQIPSRPPTTQEALEWSKVKDSTDIAALQQFIKRFPDAPLAITAQQRIDVLKRQAQQREDAQRKADAQKAAEAAQKQREEDERRAAAAEAAEKAKAAAAAAEAQKKREEDERRAAAAEAERQAKQAEADRKAKEAQQKADQAAHAKAAAEAAAAAAAAQKQAEEAAAARKQADLAAQKEAACKDQQGKLDAILAKGSAGTGVDDLKQFSRTVTCDRLGPVVAASLQRFNAEVAQRTAEAPNSLPLVRSAQTELIRLGCFTGRPDGSLTSTQAALSRYNKIEGLPTNNPVVTKDVVADLVKHSRRVCPLECNAGETLKGDVCVVDKTTPAPATSTASRKNNDEGNAPSRRKQAAREHEQPHRREQKQASRPEPQARQQAMARPSGGGGGGGGHSAIVGVGF